jgi:Trk K+ transport system NAD-binding subunit
VIIIGGGVVGKTLGKTLEEKEIGYKIIEKNPDKAISDKYFVGDASDKEFLISSGIMTSPAVAITTEDDNVNIFLTTLIRNLRPDIQIISRSNLDRAVEHLYHAGCDFVISLSSMGANSIFNLLKKGNILMIAEGVDIFKVDSPKKLIGKTIMSSTVREKTGCSIVAITSGDEIKINPEPSSVIEKGKSIVLIGNAEAETKFFNQFSDRSEN